ncbi:ROK family protein [Photobacterium gaetbulicola]|uniref:Putative sugar uptake ABC transporter permease protein n=1 Tax=Photobacterium gaetbulicola Gung47 TaxID=658445 RepID=A0A0C5WH81_9GAMM|nr:ROK family protein [Photobacterium gaetbulicola]AJR06493.1 putative sugar uptake ABC transporter permease protein [Photobacterium gaetbulicola Gung47]PSU02520.1 ROK family protein [Photobacterium gaetbulicola]
MRGTNHEDTRRFNLAAVFETVRKSGSISRVEIASRTGLRNQTITNITRELIESGLLIEAGKIKGKRGQPQTILEVNNPNACSIGIQIDKGIMTARLVDIQLNTLASYRGEMMSLEPAYIVDEIAKVINQLSTRITETQTFWGTGVAVATLINNEAPDDLLSPGWGIWKNFNLIAELSKQISTPIYLENDATAAAIGSRFSGLGNMLNNFAYLYIGNGIGAGLIVNGQPYKGAWNNAGEIGRIQWPNKGEIEYLEKLLSLSGLSRVLECPESELLMADFIEQQITLSSPQFTGWLDEAALRLKFIVNILENMLEPESIIIGSTLPNALLHKLLEHAEPLPTSICALTNRQHPRVMIAPQSNNIIATGAAAIPMYATCNPKLINLFNSTHSTPPLLA